MFASEVPSGAVDAGVDPEVAAILRALAPEEVDMLRDAFIYIDRDSDGFVSRDELMAKVAACVGADRFLPLREYLLPLFEVADKDGDGRLSLTEFLRAFADGPGVVPAEVVNTCVSGVRVRLTDEEISALQDNFRRIDTNQDGVVDPEELEAALRAHLLTKFPDLTGENFKEIVAVVMASADTDRNGVLTLSEFIRSYQEDQGVLPATFLVPSIDHVSGMRQLTEDETTVLREAFAVLDRDKDGLVDVEDLYSALWDTLGTTVEDHSHIRDLCDLIMTAAGRSTRGQLTVTDFVRGFLRHVHLMQLPVAVAQERVRVACEQLQAMHDSGELEKLVLVFEDLDRDGDGYVAREEMVGVLKTLFCDAFPGWDEEMLTSVMTAIVVGAETNNGGGLSLEEFIRSFVEGPGAVAATAGGQTWTEASSGRLPNAVAATPPSPPRGPPVRRLSTATDTDLLRLSEAVRVLHAQGGKGGGITYESLHATVAALYEDSPGHGEEMYQYALQQFVRPRGDGTLEWSENVHIEDGEEDEGCGDEAQEAPGLKERQHQQRSSSSVAAAAADAVVAAAPASSSSSRPATAQEGMRTLPKAVDSASGGAAAAAPAGVVAKPSALEGLNTASWDGTSNAYFQDDLEAQFAHYDVHHNGYLDREEFKREYAQMEHFGLEPSPAEVDSLFRRFARGSDKIYFNEFCVLMLQRARL